MSITTNVFKFANIVNGVSTAWQRAELAFDIKTEADTNKLSVREIIERVKNEYAPAVSANVSANHNAAFTEFTNFHFGKLSQSTVYKSASAFEFIVNSGVNATALTNGERNQLAHAAIRAAGYKSLNELAGYIVEWSPEEKNDIESILEYLNDIVVEALAAKKTKLKKATTPASNSDTAPTEPTAAPKPAAPVSDSDNVSATDKINAALKLIRETIESNAADLETEDITEYARELRSLSKLLTTINA